MIHNSIGNSFYILDNKPKQDSLLGPVMNPNKSELPTPFLTPYNQKEGNKTKEHKDSKQAKPKSNQDSKASKAVQNTTVVTNTYAGTKSSTTTLKYYQRPSSTSILKPIFTNSQANNEKQNQVLNKVVKDSASRAADSIATLNTLQLGPHLLKQTNTNPIQRYDNGSEWIFMVLLAIITALSFIRIVHQKSIRIFKEAFLNLNISNQVVRDDNIFLQSASLQLSFLFYGTFALYIYKLSDHFKVNTPWLFDGFYKYMILVFLVIGVYFGKQLIFRLLGNVYRLEKPFSAYAFNVVLINSMFGVILIPILILMFFLDASYMPVLIWISAAFGALGFVYRISRGITTGLSVNELSIFHLFLYLCTLEIAPLLVLWKLLS